MKKQTIKKLKIKSTYRGKPIDKLTKKEQTEMGKIMLSINSPIKPHTNFAEEIYQLKKTERLFDIVFYTGILIIILLAITLIIVN